ncbi:TetR/AcrR family transcriptional regulator [Nocardia noduli]|uniref:TetR/AcrR family transcriptional regulator n=1 Tax=Nocardia noduli TaxID=2815722 RepID=UPI0020B3D598|nr:TetR/AcrR family transcriptional regulator [Nocardia noduli]
MAIVHGARRLIQVKGVSFTTRELATGAGVTLKTFYRYFASKDQLLLAVFESILAEQTQRIEAAARELSDPLSRIHFYVTATVDSLGESSRAEEQSWARFMTAEHWRLHQIFPEEMSEADQLFADLIERELRQATAEGLLRTTDPRQASWFAMQLVMAVFHHYSYAAPETRLEQTSDQLWAFCLAAFDGSSTARRANPDEHSPFSPPRSRADAAPPQSDNSSRAGSSRLDTTRK